MGINIGVQIGTSANNTRNKRSTASLVALRCRDSISCSLYPIHITGQDHTPDPSVVYLNFIAMEKLKSINLNVRQQLNHGVPINQWLHDHGFRTRGARNKVLIDFLSSQGIYYKLLNRNYRGDFTADLLNAAQVSAFGLSREFKAFVRELTKD